MAIKSIVLELQSDAIDRGVPLSDLLRKALVVAKKLKIKEFENWIYQELSGYEKNDDIPSYRECRGQVKAFNPSRGWIPIVFAEEDTEELFSVRKNGQSIAELEQLAENVGKSSMFQMPYSAPAQNAIMKATRMSFVPTLMISAARLSGVLDTVRNIVLNWSLKLEEDGILGEGLSFTTDEIKKASKVPNNVNHFYGPVTNSQIQQAGNESTQNQISIDLDLKGVSSFLKELKSQSKDLRLKKEDKSVLDSHCESINAQLKSPKPNKPIIKEGLSTIRRILEGAGGAIAAKLLMVLSGLI